MGEVEEVVVAGIDEGAKLLYEQYQRDTAGVGRYWLPWEELPVVYRDSWVVVMRRARAIRLQER
jgi:hypothetical protein